MKARVSTRYQSHTSTPELVDAGVMLWDAIEEYRDSSALAGFLFRLRLLPLGKPGIAALCSLEITDFGGTEWLHLSSAMPRHATSEYVITIPNVFACLPAEAIRDFLRAGRDPEFLRDQCSIKLRCPLPRRFSMSTLARLYEARLSPHHTPLLIRIANFRGEDARWPVEMLLEGKTWIVPATPSAPPAEAEGSDVALGFKELTLPAEVEGLTAASGNKDSTDTLEPGRKHRPYLHTEAVICAYRTWADDPPEGSNFEFPEPDERLMKRRRDLTAYRILREIVRLEAKPGQPLPASLARYFRDFFTVLSAEAKRKAPPRVSTTMKQMHRLIEEARASLKMPCVKSKGLFSGSPAPRLLKLYLVPFRVLESLILGNPPVLTDVRAVTAYVLQMIDLYSGRRLSDFAATSFRDIVRSGNAMDFTLTKTKTTSSRGIHLPLHRLLPAQCQPILTAWWQMVQDPAFAGITPYEVVTGTAPSRDSTHVRCRLAEAFQTLDLVTFARHHQIRYAFASWAPIAVELARSPWLSRHPKLEPWIRDSAFFSEEQLAQWTEILGSQTASAFRAIACILGHSSTHELEVDYCITWSMLMLIASLRIERAMLGS